MLQHNKIFWTILRQLCEQFGEGPFLFHHDCASAQSKVIMTWLGEIGVEEHLTSTALNTLRMN